MKLFEPGKIGNLTIKNRIAMAPMLNLLPEPVEDGRASKREIDFFAERAKGGTGQIITTVMRPNHKFEDSIGENDTMNVGFSIKAENKDEIDTFSVDLELEDLPPGWDYSFSTENFDIDTYNGCVTINIQSVEAAPADPNPLDPPVGDEIVMRVHCEIIFAASPPAGMIELIINSGLTDSEDNPIAEAYTLILNKP